MRWTMGRIRRKQLVCIPEDLFAVMRAALDYEALGVACTLIEFQHRVRGGLVDDEKIHKKLGLQIRTWTRLREQISPLFDLRSGRWCQPVIAEQIALRAASGADSSAQILPSGTSSRRASAARKKPGAPSAASRSPSLDRPVADTPDTGKPCSRVADDEIGTPLMFDGLDSETEDRVAFAENKLGRLRPPGPSAASSAGPKSLITHAIEAGVSLIMASGKSEDTARKVMGQLVRDHSIARVMEAVAAAEKRTGEIANPVGYLRSLLAGVTTQRPFGHRSGGMSSTIDRAADNPDITETDGLSEDSRHRLRSAISKRQQFSFCGESSPLSAELTADNAVPAPAPRRRNSTT